MKRLFFIITAALLIASCNQPLKKPETKMNEDKKALETFAPEWTNNKNIYEVNIRNFTPEGTLNAFANHLPRLQAMGVDIIWLMPVNPIGEMNRKGSLGSYYSIKDYTQINPDFGTLEDFRNLVKQAHSLGMYVIIDWVANHAAWDNTWTKNHPEYFIHDENGNFTPPVPDWSDVIDLNYDNPQMRQAMIDAMKFWVSETDIDGFRCDVAMMVPVDFWEDARSQLDSIKSVFMLAEAEEPAHHFASFDASYSWELMHTFNDIAKGSKNSESIDSLLRDEKVKFPAKAFRLRFITNHDENSWNGTEFQRLGDGVDAFTVLCYTLPGMPLVYSGQESAFNRALRFFDKDQIDWGNYSKQKFFRALNHLKHEHECLWNGSYGGDMITVFNHQNNHNIYAFLRCKKESIIGVIVNLSNQPEKVTLVIPDTYTGKYKDYFRGPEFEIGKEVDIAMQAWEYRVFEKVN
ncbi:MAG: alpha-amylase [Bacteroidales bacterium]|nr:alpha-amylase [Bacteroidales bacterium]HOY39931.1 alpha-amylase family glycosyl hydrolase [Bacteroidales bacterium]HQP03674.1 alpha-amylase family glycosyl hydrolase [Bacteroidales bacterium]